MVLYFGLMVEKRDDYIIKSNKESGFGRYDVNDDTTKCKDR